MSYAEFLHAKSQQGAGSGFAPTFLPDFLFDFQHALLDWSIRQGRSAMFADCGLGKTPMELVWAENMARHTRGSVLILTPLAVTAQMEREAEKFGIGAKVSRDGAVHRITITNYERLHYFNPSDFAACACDESSILKSFDGKRKGEITQFMGVGSEVYSPLMRGRRAIGAELKASYFKQAAKNCELGAKGVLFENENEDLFGGFDHAI